MVKFKNTVVQRPSDNNQPSYFFSGPHLLPLKDNIVLPETPREGLVLLIDVLHRIEDDDFATLVMPPFIPTEEMIAKRRPLNFQIVSFPYHESIFRLGLFHPLPPQREDEWYGRRKTELKKGSAASRILKSLPFCVQYESGIPKEIVSTQEWMEECAALRPSAKLENADGRPKNYMIHHMVRGTDWEDRGARDFAEYGHFVIPAKYGFPAKPLLMEAGTIYHPYYTTMSVSIDRIEAQTGYIIEMKCPTPRNRLDSPLPLSYTPDSPSILPHLRKVDYYEDVVPFDPHGSSHYYHQVNMQAFVLDLPTVFLVKYNILTGGMTVVRCWIDPDWFSKFGPEMFRAERDVMRLRRDTGWSVEKHEMVNK